MPATFNHTAGSVSFRSGPHRPDNSLAVVQPQRKSAGAVRFGYAHTIVNDIKQLTIRATTAEKDQFITFFNTVARGMAELFTYTTPTGQTIAARFARPDFGLTEKAYDSWEINADLRVAGAAWGWSPATGLLWADGQGVAL